jgi:hypothetical protein
MGNVRMVQRQGRVCFRDLLASAASMSRVQEDIVMVDDGEIQHILHPDPTVFQPSSRPFIGGHGYFQGFVHRSDEC